MLVSHVGRQHVLDLHGNLGVGPHDAAATDPQLEHHKVDGLMLIINNKSGTCFTPGPGAVLVVVTSVLLVTRDTARLTTASSITTLISTIPAHSS